MEDDPSSINTRLVHPSMSDLPEASTGMAEIGVSGASMAVQTSNVIGITGSLRDNEYNNENCRSKEYIDSTECNNGNIFDINKLQIFYDNDDAIVEENVVFGDDGHVLEWYEKASHAKMGMRNASKSNSITPTTAVKQLAITVECSLGLRADVSS
ncbi:hypothetical protein Sjap_023578 [Stephania japonica]|uniref:Uncharacterized protein n=1 Tax=Stephania japonica TaxID=461633 RepID=A0AAP0EBU6_9MAGN